MIHVARLSLQGDVIVAIGGKPIAGQSMDAVNPGKPVLLHDLLPAFLHDSLPVLLYGKLVLPQETTRLGLTSNSNVFL